MNGHRVKLRTYTPEELGATLHVHKEPNQNARVAELEDITKGVDWAKWHDALEIQCALESHQALLAKCDALAATCKLLAEALENVGHADDCGPDRPMTLEEWRNRECTCGRDAALAAYHALEEKP